MVAHSPPLREGARIRPQTAFSNLLVVGQQIVTFWSHNRVRRPRDRRQFAYASHVTQYMPHTAGRLSVESEASNR